MSNISRKSSKFATSRFDEVRKRHENVTSRSCAKARIGQSDEASPSSIDAYYMSAALRLAKQAADLGEIPVGAVIVRNGGNLPTLADNGDTAALDEAIIGRGGNRTERDGVVTHHAEIIAIEQASAAVGTWRLSGCTLYVTLEPCPMCAGALIASRIDRIVFGAKDSRSGSFGSLLDLRAYPLFSKPKVISGVLGTEASELLSQFFENRRRG